MQPNPFVESVSSITPHLDWQLVRLHPIAKVLNQTQKALGVRLVLVGGLLRDFWLTGQLSKDWDVISLNGEAEISAQKVSEQLDGRLVMLDEEWGIARIILPDGVTIDIANALENNLQQDLRRRDLTINALALDLETGDLIDDLGNGLSGLSDLKSNTIRALSEKNMADDPLRLLRVFRVAAELPGFTVEPETLSLVEKMVNLLPKAAPERQHYEFLRLLSAPRPFAIVQQMLETGLLEVFLPELTPCREVPANTHHHLPLLAHTLELLNQCELVAPTLDEQTQALLQAPVTPFANNWALVRLACLLHDIGKPQTFAIVKQTTEDGMILPDKHTFYGHEKAGETLCEVIFTRWRLAGQVAATVKKLVRWHLYPCQFGPQSPVKSVFRFFRRMGDDTPLVTVLALADRLSTNGPAISPAMMAEAVEAHHWLLKRYYQERAVLKAPPLLSGHEVMTLLKLKSGPKVGQTLERLKEAHQLGQIATPEEAKTWLVKEMGL